ncbi:hypothetical protein E8P82_07585 [Arthrobacter echini]|uniref:Uncharacterized protein n=1 Tax=Arthrobacter echini TaxID=1529066 RepID=A0A4S5E5J3_9MICC|nr:hypothetical protein [Arthrobacter echini]THJ66784.1 hypothetical protein E8P82_07585 [Arthrobacter echini]
MDSTGEVGHLYVYHYTTSSTTLELSFTHVPKVAATPANVRRFDGFLSALGEINEFRTAAETLKESGWKRRPNMPLTDLSTEALRRLVDAVDSMRSEGPVS